MANFTQLQKGMLKELHKDVDTFMYSFELQYATMVTDTIEGLLKPKGTPTKIKKIYQIPKNELLIIKKSVDKLKKRMLEITNGVQVRSITNKLIYPVPDAKFYYVRKSLGCKSEKIPLLEIDKKIEMIKEDIDTYDNIVFENKKALLDKYRQIKEFCIDNDLDYIQYRQDCNHIVLLAFDENMDILPDVDKSKGLPLLSGVVLPQDAQKVEYFRGNKRKKAVPENNRLYLFEDNKKYYILDSEHYKRYHKK